jgi:hypothetical protein
MMARYRRSATVGRAVSPPPSGVAVSRLADGIDRRAGRLRAAIEEDLRLATVLVRVDEQAAARTVLRRLDGRLVDFVRDLRRLVARAVSERDAGETAVVSGPTAPPRRASRLPAR